MTVLKPGVVTVEPGGRVYSSKLAGTLTARVGQPLLTNSHNVSSAYCQQRDRQSALSRELQLCLRSAAMGKWESESCPADLL